jgi:hypothetical protein
VKNERISFQLEMKKCAQKDSEPLLSNGSSLQIVTLRKELQVLMPGSAKASAHTIAVIKTTTRQMIAVAVTKNTKSAWLEAVIRNAFLDVEKHLLVKK